MKAGFGTGLAAAMAAALTWGIQLPLAKDAFVAVDPFHITSFRYLVAVLLMIPALVWRVGWRSLSYRGHGGMAALIGVIGICGSPMLTFVGMSLSRAEHAVVIVSVQPLLASLALWVLRGIRPAMFSLGCMLLAFAGVVLVVTKGRPVLQESPAELMGDGLVLLGAICWIVYTMGLARLAGWSTWRITVLTMLPGAVAATAVTETLVLIGYLSMPESAAIASIGWELAYLTVVGVLLAMLAWNYGVQRIGGLNATLFINFMPVVAFSYRAFQGYRFEAIELVGAGCVVVALIGNNLYQRRLARQAMA